VSKLPKIALGPRPEEQKKSHMDEQAENLRQMFIAMSEDFRIIIVKLADRLHNMRTLGHMPPEKQIRISRETLDIFAPLAHRLGIWQFKSELEDTAFMYLYPKQHAQLKRQLNEQGGKFRESLQGSKAALESILFEDSMLKEQEVTVTVTGRMKEMYPLWLKMETKHQGGLEHFDDVVALRVILDLAQRPGEPQDEWKTRGVWLCYHVLGLVQHLPECQPVPSQVKDYISFPKPNGYQSLHTSIMRNGQKVEVQIRTNWMHSIAQYGMAAHWLYKDERYGGAGVKKVFNKYYKVAWMDIIKEWQDEIHNSTEFVDAIRRELLGKRVFVFLRDGKILNLSRGATVIDAAFAIHTEVGLKMSAAQINGQNMPISYELQNGDVVSIITAEEGRPSLDWMRFARSRSTRAKLRGYFRSQQRTANVQKGWLYVHDFMDQHAALVINRLGHLPSDDELLDMMRRVAGSGDNFCVALAQTKNHAVLRASMAQLLALRFDQVEEHAALHCRRLGDATIPSEASVTPTLAFGVLVKEEEAGSGGGDFTGCEPVDVGPHNVCRRCMPVPGDSVAGRINPTTGEVLVHLSECPELQQEEDVTEAVPVAWEIVPPHSDCYDDETGTEIGYISEIQVYCEDRRFLLRDVSDVVALETEIIRTSSQTIDDKAMLQYKVFVSNYKNLASLIRSVCNIPGVKSCERLIAET
jgi:RelA/SpoT family (p)ppGpp synthetase